MSSEMIERVAKALCGCNAPNEEPWNELGLREQQDYRRMARTAIEAMREPTDGMRAAGRDAIQPSLYQGRVAQRVRHQWQIADEAWAAMISAASAEQ